jgi:DNA polymerase-3 subunit beta
MKFTCEKQLLEKAFSLARRATPNRSGASVVLSGLFVELKKNTLVVLGSDLDLTIRIQLEVGGAEDGKTVIPGALLADIIRVLDDGQISFLAKEEEVQIKSGKSEFNLRTLPVDEFPRFEEPGGNEATLDTKSLATAFEQVVKAASMDDARPILTGVLLAAEQDGLRLVATDSYRMAVRDIPGTEILSRDEIVLVPSRALDVVKRVLDEDDELIVILGEKEAVFKIGNIDIVTRLIEGEFPNYKGLIPEKNQNKLVVNREEMLAALQRVKLLARESTPVRLIMSDKKIELLAIETDIGQATETIDGNYFGEEITVAFNADYLIDGLEVISTDEISLETTDALKPAILKGLDEETFLYLLMPVRVS